MSNKPSWYAIEARGILGDAVNLLHAPYTLWHLSYVAIGISLSPVIHPLRSVAVIVAFFLGLGIGAHALDETMGNPLRTKLSKRQLYAIGFTSLSIAIAIGLYYVLVLSLFLLPFVILETFFAVTYNLEIFRSKLHSAFVFALSWGSIPLLTGYFVNAFTLNIPIILVAVAVGLLTHVQRTLSTEARRFRRKPKSVESLHFSDGSSSPTSTEELVSPIEKSLKALTIMVFVLAVALILFRLV